MSYEAWKEERTAYWKSIDDANAKYSIRPNVRTESYQSSDEFYYGLAEDIEQRQIEATPIAGEGFREFFTALGNVSALGSKVFPPLRIVTLTSRGLLAIEEFR